MGKQTRYIVLEGGEGTYKSTTISAVAQRLRDMGYSVLVSKEPGTDLIPLTMELRKIMLDNQYDALLPPYAREFISQAIRQIHIEKLIRPAYASGEYDFILQDRGILSGVIYAIACGVWRGADLTPIALGQPGIASDSTLYDLTVVLYREQHSLHIATSAKREYEQGDAMESRSDAFHSFVSNSFKGVLQKDDPFTKHAFSNRIAGVDVDLYTGKPSEMAEAVLKEILTT